MASANVTLTGAWSQVIAGAANIDFYNETGVAVLIAVGAAPPANDSTALEVRAGQTVPVRAPAGQNIYGRSPYASAAVIGYADA